MRQVARTVRGRRGVTACARCCPRTRRGARARAPSGAAAAPRPFSSRASAPTGRAQFCLTTRHSRRGAPSLGRWDSNNRRTLLWRLDGRWDVLTRRGPPLVMGRRMRASAVLRAAAQSPLLTFNPFPPSSASPSSACGSSAAGVRHRLARWRSGSSLSPRRRGGAWCGDRYFRASRVSRSAARRASECACLMLPLTCACCVQCESRPAHTGCATRRRERRNRGRVDLPWRALSPVSLAAAPAWPSDHLPTKGFSHSRGRCR